jgi:Bacterial PH domain
MSDVSHLSAAASLGARREVAMLPRLLGAGEQVIDVCHGTTDGRPAVMVVTDRRVLYMQRRRLWGADVESTPLTHVRSAEDHMGVRHATVVIEAGGRVFEVGDVDRALAQMFCARLRAQLTRQ